MINALLVRYARGWHEVTDPAAIAAHGRREGTLSLGVTESVNEVERVAGRLIGANAEVREAISVDLKPTGAGDQPYAAFGVADRVTVPGRGGAPTVERVTTLTVAEDENGQLSWVPELKDVLLTRAERLEQAIAKMANGSLAGRSPVASPGIILPTPAPIVLPATGGGPTATQWAASVSSGFRIGGLSLEPDEWGLVPTPYFWFASDPDTVLDENDLLVIPHSGAYVVGVEMNDAGSPDIDLWVKRYDPTAGYAYRDVMPVGPALSTRAVTPLLAGDRLVVEAHNTGASTVYGIEVRSLDAGFLAPMGEEDIPPTAT